MLHPMANMAVRANSVKHLECQIAVTAIVRGIIGSKMVLRSFFARKLARAPIMVLESTTALPTTAISNPWIQSKIMRETWLVRGIE
jgi:hypothetical protein